MYDRIYYAKKLYDQILVGKIDRFPHELFEYGVITNEKTALEVIRYSFEYYMRWKPKEIQQISLELLKKLSLDSLLAYIDFPDGIKNKKESLVYLLSILYLYIQINIPIPLLKLHHYPVCICRIHRSTLCILFQERNCFIFAKIQ